MTTATQPDPTAKPPDPRPTEHHWVFFIWLEAWSLPRWLLFHRTAVAMVLSWLAPIVFMGVGAAFFPPLRAVAASPSDALGEAGGGLFVQLLLVFAWMGHEVWYTTNRNTPVGHLQADVVGDVTIALALTAACALMACDGGVPWWFIVPYLGTLVDVYQSPVFGINNAVEKPFFPTRGST